MVLFLFLPLPAAMDYLLTHPKSPADVAALEEASGVGVVVTPEEVEDAVGRGRSRTAGQHVISK